MKYQGPLFGRVGRSRKYFDTGKTSDDWDRMEADVKRLEWLTRYWDSQCVGLQPLADDALRQNPTGSVRDAIDHAMNDEGRLDD